MSTCEYSVSVTFNNLEVFNMTLFITILQLICGLVVIGIVMIGVFDI